LNNGIEWDHVGDMKRTKAPHLPADRVVDNVQRVLVTMGVLALSIALVAFVVVLNSRPPRSERVLPPPNTELTKAKSNPKKSQSPILPPPGGVAGSNVDLSHVSSEATFADPTALRIPAIGLQTTVVALGRNPDGSAAVPSATTFTGWYDLGPVPGEIGPAVIIGHVDSYTGPGVFFNLKSLLPGDIITVIDGSAPVSFRIQQVVTYAKDDFPTDEVFGPTPDAELRLITCGGPFDRAIGHYEDNVVVYARAI
jgi:sortase (surface protein transpeptidase)